MFVLKGEEKKRNKERKFRSDIENEDELNADGQSARHALATHSTLRDVQLTLLGHPRPAQQTQTQPFQSPFLLQRECAKIQSNITCKSSISPVSRQILWGVGGRMCQKTPTLVELDIRATGPRGTAYLKLEPTPTTHKFSLPISSLDQRL